MSHVLGTGLNALVESVSLGCGFVMVLMTVQVEMTSSAVLVSYHNKKRHGSPLYKLVTHAGPFFEVPPCYSRNLRYSIPNLINILLNCLIINGQKIFVTNQIR